MLNWMPVSLLCQNTLNLKLIPLAQFKKCTWRIRWVLRETKSDKTSFNHPTENDT